MLMRNIVRITRIGQTGTRFMSVRPRSQVNTMIIPQNMSDLASMVGTGYKVFDNTRA